MDIYWLLQSWVFVIAERNRSDLPVRGHSHEPLLVDRPLEISVEVLIVVVHVNTNGRRKRRGDTRRRNIKLLG